MKTMRIASLLLLFSICHAKADSSLPIYKIVLSNQEYPPYLGQNLPWNGLMSRVVKEVFAQENVIVTYEFFPNNRTLQSARNGNVDGSLGWAETPERQKDLLFTNPVMALRMVFFQRTDHPIPWKKLSDLKPYILGATAGNTYSDEFSQLQRTGVLKVETAPDDLTNLRKLLAKHIDLFPIDQEVGAMLINQHFTQLERDQISPQTTAFWSAPICVVIWRGQPHATELVRRFNIGLAKLKNDGEFDRLVEQTRRAISH